MGRTLHIENLRTTEPRTLEVLVQDALQKPILQLSAAMLADLVALSEVEGLPKSLARGLGAFRARAGREIADLPDGSVLNAFLDDLEVLPAHGIPLSLREHLDAEARREDRVQKDRERIVSILEGWARTPPAPIVLARPAAKIQQIPAAEPEEEKTSPKAIRKKSSAPPKRRSTPEATDRERWIVEACLAQLADYGDRGLTEPVLVAGVRHDARESYPDLMPHEVTKALKTLLANGRVRRSSGRWNRTDRIW